MNISQLFPILSQAIPFVAVFAGFAAAFIMYRVTQRFSGGILAAGFASITFGVFFIAGGILLDVFATYFVGVNDTLSTVFLFTKGMIFVVGTYIIVVGSKRMADRLEESI